MAKDKFASKAGAVFKKHWPLIVGGGVALGLAWRFMGGSKSTDDAGASFGDSDYYAYQLQAAQMAQANAAQNAQIGAQLQIAAAQAQALQDQGQAQIIAAQAGLANSVGDTFSDILGVALLPQLEAMKQSGAVAQSALGAAAMSQITVTEAMASDNASMFDMLTGLGYGNVASIKGAQQATTAMHNTASNNVASTTNTFFKSFFGGGMFG